MPLCGGLGEVKPADDNVHGILEKVGTEFRSKVGEKRQADASSVSDIKPVAVAYKSQVVAGTNYFIKVKVAESDFIHARVYKDLQGNVTLHSVSDVKKDDDEIAYF